jgi:hypothetical protein
MIWALLGAAALGFGGQASAQAEDLGWGTAVPISTRAPAWLTPALYQRVVAAGPRGVPLSSVDRGTAGKGSGASSGGSSPCLYSSGTAPSGSSVPASPSGVERPPVGLGPGTWLISLFCVNVGGTPVPDGFAWCTANFVFANGSQLGLGTAGHCAARNALGSPVTAVVTPPPEVCANGGSCEPGLYAIGTFKIVHNNGLGDDFALISLYPQFNSWVRPTMPVFGGPTGAYLGGLAGVPGQTLTAGPATVSTPAWSPAVVGHCGHGVVVGTGGTCRTSAGLFSASTWYAWYGPSAEGDSGSGVEVVGDYAAPANPVPAAADLTHIIFLDASLSRSGQLSEGPGQPGMVGGTQMSKILSIVGSSWTLVTGGVP